MVLNPSVEMKSMPTRRPIESEQPRHPADRPLRILHLEDDKGYAALVHLWLKKDLQQPFEIVHCTDSRQAVTLIRQGHRFDVAISDVRLDQPPLTAREQASKIPHAPVDLLAHLQQEQGTHPVLLTGLAPQGKALIQHAGLAVIIKDTPARQELLHELRQAIDARRRNEEEKPIDRHAMAAIGPLLHVKGGRAVMLELLASQPMSKQAIRDMYAGKRVVVSLADRIKELQRMQQEGHLGNREADRVEKWIAQLESMRRTPRVTSPNQKRRPGRF